MKSCILHGRLIINCFLCLASLALASPSHAALISTTITGSFTTWFENDYASEDTAITLQAEYDESWIKTVHHRYFGDIRIVNIIDHYSQGARLSLTIGDRVFHEINSENPFPSSDLEGHCGIELEGAWCGSIPYLILDQADNPTGLDSLWLDFIYLSEPLHRDVYQIADHGTGGISVSGGTMGLNGRGESRELIATLTSVPVPAAAWLFGSALLGLAGLKRRST